jgi:hypothetical protein
MTKFSNLIWREILNIDDKVPFLLNDGPLIASTNFWDSHRAKDGLLFLTYNAYAARLLVPDSQLQLLAEMRTGKYVIISAGPRAGKSGRDGVELMFEDDTDSPFALTLDEVQLAGFFPDSANEWKFVVTVWTRAGLQMKFAGRYRSVPRIPFLLPWVEKRDGPAGKLIAREGGGG